MYLKWI